MWKDELANKAAEIRKRFDQITEEWKLLTLPKNAGKRKRSPSSIDENRETCSLVVESDVLGRVEEKDMLVEWLLSKDDTTRNGVSVMVVIGMGGLGKTTLAQHPRVKSYFDLRGWVYVSENFHDGEDPTIIYKSESS
ncbi:putative disease resistance RPP13-like protein 1 [Zingiber officinale]|uniref:putative disease resistance RPP13-like protein 1 n=1 Tax=Zingiber officinale TaxID=94328 RepID=UPI001C4BB85D|nr:putative disease resistance RPP13-like protein 1 [Zingiber officinale]